MPDTPGFFHVIRVDGPSESIPLCNWVLVNAAGDIVAESTTSVSRATAEATIQWIIDNARGFQIFKPPPFKPIRSGKNH
jgi:hypothetical protein